MYAEVIIEVSVGEWESYAVAHPMFIKADALEWCRRDFDIMPEKFSKPDENLKDLDIDNVSPQFNVAGLWWRIKNESKF